MNKVVGLLFLAPFSVLAGENGGVSEPNFEAGTTYRNTDDNQVISVNGAYRAGIGEYFGYSLFGSIGRLHGEGDVLDSDSATAGADLFAREFDLGKLGFSYAHIYSRIESPSDDISLSSDSYRLFADCYFRDLTLGVSRSTIRSSDVSDVNSWTASARAYFSDNTRISAAAGGLDAKDSYALTVEYQPLFFSDAASISLSYNKSPDDDSYSLGINYFFGNNISLKRRDREFR